MTFRAARTSAPSAATTLKHALLIRRATPYSSWQTSLARSLSQDTVVPTSSPYGLWYAELCRQNLFSSFPSPFARREGVKRYVRELYNYCRWDWYEFGRGGRARPSHASWMPVSCCDNQHHLHKTQLTAEDIARGHDARRNELSEERRQSANVGRTTHDGIAALDGPRRPKKARST